VNLIVTREDNKDAENVKKFVQAYQSMKFTKQLTKSLTAAQ
jgi:ABC-type metal ion transport system substrate-binding protein